MGRGLFITIASLCAKVLMRQGVKNGPVDTYRGEKKNKKRKRREWLLSCLFREGEKAGILLGGRKKGHTA